MLVGPAVIGALAGAGVLLVSPANVFEAVVPFLVLLAGALLAAQPRVSAWVTGRRGAPVAGVPRVLVLLVQA